VATLEEDSRRVNNVMDNLDTIQSDLVISNKASACSRLAFSLEVLSVCLLQLITGFLKRLYTDKIIIMFTCIVLCVIVGIIVYAKVKGNKSTGVLTPPTP
jgi:hypothetical protein